jgi:phage FluMu protein Com
MKDYRCNRCNKLLFKVDCVPPGSLDRKIVKILDVDALSMFEQVEIDHGRVFIEVKCPRCQEMSKTTIKDIGTDYFQLGTFLENIETPEVPQVGALGNGCTHP